MPLNFQLPSFLNPLAAAIAAAIVIPLLVILYFLKLRRKEMPVSSTFLWKKSIQDLQVNSPFQKLRRNLLMLLQLLLLAFLCLALSRPVINSTMHAGKLNVILIDRSASMNTVEDYDGKKRTRLDEAKRQAISLVESMNRKESAMVISFDDGAQVVTTLTGDSSSLKNGIRSIEPTDRRSKLKLGYKLAEAQVKFFPEQMRANEKPTLFVYSDGRIADAKELSVQGDITYVKIGKPETSNIGIVSLNAQRNYEHPTEVQVFARLANYGPEPISTDVQLVIDGQPRGSKNDLFLLPERWNEPGYKRTPDQEKMQARDSVDFPKIELTTSSVIRLEQLKVDANPVDDTATIVVPPPKNLSVLLVSDGNYFLSKVLQSMSLDKPQTVSTIEYEQLMLKGELAAFDVMIFDRYNPKLMPEVGNFIWFGAVTDKIKVRTIMESNGLTPVVMSDTMVLDWKRDHPLLRGLQLGKLYIKEGIKLKLPIESETLIEGFKGPLVVLHREGRSVHLIVAFDLVNSNWPLKLSFPIFMHNAMQFLALGTDMDVRESFQPGATPKIPRTSIQKIEADTGKPIKELKMDGPTGKHRIAIPGNGDIVLPALDKVGLYTIDPPVPQFDKFAVNLLDPAESNITPIDQPPGGGVAMESNSGRTRMELWWWIIACMALPLLMIEWWVYTRRVHL